MYDREIVKRLITSPFTSNLDDEIIEKEFIAGFKAGVRSQICAPGQIDLLSRLNKEYGNGQTRLGMVIGYPYGGMSTNMKCFLIKEAVKGGLDEVDVAFNVTAAASYDFEAVKTEMQAIIDAGEGKIRIIPMLWMVKFSFEIVDGLCKVYRELGLKNVKTSAGIHFGEMQLEHISWLHRNYPEISIEIAGKVRQREKAEDMFEAGADYIHTGSWRKLSGIGIDPGYDFDTKENSEAEFYLDPKYL
ncbi:MAG: hypothetical protein AB1Z19_05355 [Eubacteriales bacterium]